MQKPIEQQADRKPTGQTGGKQLTGQPVDRQPTVQPEKLQTQQTSQTQQIKGQAKKIGIDLDSFAEDPSNFSEDTYGRQPTVKSQLQSQETKKISTKQD